MHEIIMQKHLSSVQQIFTAGSVISGADLLGEPEKLTSKSTIAATLVNVMNRSGPELCLGSCWHQLEAIGPGWSAMHLTLHLSNLGVMTNIGSMLDSLHQLARALLS